MIVTCTRWQGGVELWWCNAPFHRASVAYRIEPLRLDHSDGRLGGLAISSAGECCVVRFAGTSTSVHAAVLGVSPAAILSGLLRSRGLLGRSTIVDTVPVAEIRIPRTVQTHHRLRWDWVWTPRWPSKLCESDLA